MVKVTREIEDTVIPRILLSCTDDDEAAIFYIVD